MRKIIALLVAVIFTASNPVFAATALSDAEMDTIAAGDWVVLTDASGNQTVESELYYSTNDIKIKDQSQMLIQAVSNTNTVDSAVAVQTNIASVTGEEPINNSVSQSNTADLKNYNPSEEKNKSFEKSDSASKTFSINENLTKTESFTLGSSYSSWNNKTITKDENETLDISVAYAAASETDCSKNCEGESVSSLAVLVDYDKIEDFDLFKDSGKLASKTITKTESFTKNKTALFNFSESSSKKFSSSYRKNLSENNHIDLEDTSQQNIQAVSNLNAVGSAVAVQTNIATNVGVAGSITHSNVATAVNGI